MPEPVELETRSRGTARSPLRQRAATIRSGRRSGRAPPETGLCDARRGTCVSSRRTRAQTGVAAAAGDRSRCGDGTVAISGRGARRGKSGFPETPGLPGVRGRDRRARVSCEHDRRGMFGPGATPDATRSVGGRRGGLQSRPRALAGSVASGTLVSAFEAGGAFSTRTLHARREGPPARGRRSADERPRGPGWAPRASVRPCAALACGSPVARS